MAGALARGWGRPVLASDGGSGRARRLVEQLGGEALSNAEVAERADILILAHKPYQLEAVAEQARGHAKTVVSVLGGTSTETLQAAYPGAEVFVMIPNTPVEVRRGVTVHVEGPHSGARNEVLGLFRELGVVVSVPEHLAGAATALSGCAPAFLALVAEAEIDAGIRHGLKPWDAENLVIETLAGTAELLLLRDRDTLALRREVTSPGGSTARGLAALEQGGVRDAFAKAVDAVANK